jgi:hypothetical protein
MLHYFGRFRFAFDLQSGFLGGFGVSFLIPGVADLMNPILDVLLAFRMGLPPRSLLIRRRLLWAPLVLFCGMAVLLVCPQFVHRASEPQRGGACTSE